MKIFQSDDISRVKSQIAGAENIIITGHLNPDGDAIGSCLALFHLLKKMNKDVTVIMPNDYPDFLKWMPANENILIYTYHKQKISDSIKKSDIHFVIDYNEFARLGEMASEIKHSNPYVIMLDHHPNPVIQPNVQFSDINASAAAEIVYRFIVNIYPDYLDDTIAQCLFTGMMTDSGCFGYNNANTETFRIASELLTYEIDKEKIMSQIYDTFSFDRMRLMGYVLNEKLITIPEHNAAYFCLTTEELKRYNYKIGDCEGFVNLPLSINGIGFSTFFLEKEQHIKLSFRSKGSFNTNEFARKYFSGGGHKNASGGKSFDNLSITVEKFKNALADFYSQTLISDSN